MCIRDRFNRQDVLNYIESSARESKERVAALQKEAEEAKQAGEAARREADAAKGREEDVYKRQVLNKGSSRAGAQNQGHRIGGEEELEKGGLLHRLLGDDVSQVAYHPRTQEENGAALDEAQERPSGLIEKMEAGEAGDQIQGVAEHCLLYTSIRWIPPSQ